MKLKKKIYEAKEKKKVTRLIQQARNPSHKYVLKKKKKNMKKQLLLKVAIKD